VPVGPTKNGSISVLPDGAESSALREQLLGRHMPADAQVLFHGQLYQRVSRLRKFW